MRDIWKDQAINELELYRARLNSLKSIPEQIAELEESLTSIRSPAADRVSVRGGGGTDDKYLNILVKCDLLRESLTESQRSTTRVYNAMCSLPDIEARILERRFMDKEEKAVTNMAKEMDVDPRTVRNYLSDALKKFTVAMYG